MLIILKPPHENNECHEFKKQEVLSKSSFCFMLMYVYQRSSDSCDHEFLLTKLKCTVCLIQYDSLRVLNETLSRQYFPCKMKLCKNYLILMALCYQYKQNRNVNIIIIKIMTIMILMMIIIIIVIILVLMIMIIKMILIIAVLIIIINNSFQPGVFFHWIHHWNYMPNGRAIIVYLIVG